ncbi:MAG: Flp family type IVb pilin [Alphaproteobacteria bacterium]|nr:Flp family type IVb pilin [Alphaproteobacteria bacterium]
MLVRYDATGWKLQAFKDESGATAVEYALIAAGIAIAIVVSVGLIGGGLAVFFNSVSSDI